MSTHRAAVVADVGQPFKQEVVPTPNDLAPYEVLVRNHALGINALDWKQREYGPYPIRWPAVLGMDSAGVVEAVGSEVKNVQVGDHVACFTNFTQGFAYGAFQDVIKVWAACTVRAPESMSFASAATLPVSFMTAAVMTGLTLGLPVFGHAADVDVDAAKTPVVVLGGSSSVGQMALQILRAHGFTRLVATSSARNFALARKAGATALVDYGQEDVVERIEEAVGGKAPYVLDCVSAQETAAKIVEPRTGKVSIALRPVKGIEWPIDPPTFTSSYRFYDLPSTSPGKGKNPADFAFGEAATRWLADAVRSGELAPVIAQTVDGKQDLAQAVGEALEMNKKGVSGVKLVVTT